MAPIVIPERTCRRCGSGDYMFRARRTVDADLEDGGGQVTETMYQCKACNKQWKVRVPEAEKKAG